MLLRRKVLCVTGGTPSGIDIVVATPGRLLDLIDRAAMNMHRLTYLVFDEADKMLALEMEAQLRKILDFANICPRQTLLFSATFPETVERLIRSAVLNPIYIRVGQKKVGQAGLIPKTVTQSVLFMHSFQKKEQLLWVLRGIEYPPVLIFCNTHHTVDKVTALLKTEQFHVAALHSFKKQSYRSRIMKAFREGRLDILVGTDLASRGIDVSEISHVILYDMPDTIETYINRVGRTGRAGRPGQATLFLTLDCKIASELRQLLEANNQVSVIFWIQLLFKFDDITRWCRRSWRTCDNLDTKWFRQSLEIEHVNKNKGSISVVLTCVD
jgi:superfamily II DNA/RNA helicase